MQAALEVKFHAQGLDRTKAIEILTDAVYGQDWESGYTFPDGSSISVNFWPDEQDVERCNIFCFDEKGKAPKPVVRARFTCRYLEEGNFVNAFYNGSTLRGVVVPLFTQLDMQILSQCLSDVRIIERRVPAWQNPNRVNVEFSVRHEGSQWGEHSTVSPIFVDLGDRVIEVFPCRDEEWEWRPFYSLDEIT